MRMLRAGYRPPGVARALGIPRSTVYHIAKRHRDMPENVADRQRSGRPRKRVPEKTGLYVHWLDNIGHRPPRSSVLCGMFLRLYALAMSDDDWNGADSIFFYELWLYVRRRVPYCDWWLSWQRLNALMIVSRLYYIATQKHVLPSVHYSDVNMNIYISTE